MPEPIFDSPEDGAEPHENIIQTKKCPEPNPTNWPADVPTLPGVPTISDFSNAEHNVDVTNTEFENAKKAVSRNAFGTHIKVEESKETNICSSNRNSLSYILRSLVMYLLSEK